MPAEGLPPAPSDIELLDAGYEAQAVDAMTAAARFCTSPYEPVPWQQTGIASVYARKFHRRLTANGEHFDTNKLTAAHPLLKFGTLVLVTRVSNGRNVVVRINDRGPYHGGRILDLSAAAARKLGMNIVSVTRVTIEVLRAWSANDANQ